jgi:hypothetical protein
MPITREPRHGFSMEGRITNGSQRAPSRYSGFMENVRLSHPVALGYPITSLICSWLRQEYTLVRIAFVVFCP